VKPEKVPEGSAAIPLVMVHGWPGSFYEFYGLIPLLTEPEDPQDLVFEVVCPSIPGYGFSEAPHKKGESAKRDIYIDRYIFIYIYLYLYRYIFIFIYLYIYI